VRRSDLPAKNDDEVCLTDRSAWFAGKPRSYNAAQCKNRCETQLLVRAAPRLKKSPSCTPVTSERAPLCERV
jgi:hypothetical protein